MGMFKNIIIAMLLVFAVDETAHASMNVTVASGPQFSAVMSWGVAGNNHLGAGVFVEMPIIPSLTAETGLVFSQRSYRGYIDRDDDSKYGVFTYRSYLVPLAARYWLTESLGFTVGGFVGLADKNMSHSVDGNAQSDVNRPGGRGEFGFLGGIRYKYAFSPVIAAIADVRYAQFISHVSQVQSFFGVGFGL